MVTCFNILPCPKKLPSLQTSLLVVYITILIQLSCDCTAQFPLPDVSDPCASAATQHHHGDIAYFVSGEELADAAGEANTEKVKKRGATSRADLLWPEGIVYYSFSISFTESETMEVVEAMRHWEDHTCIRFRKRTNQFSYINFFQGSGCCSYVGYLNYGMQGISLAKRCLKFPTIVHEIGHAIGFWHEHTRPDRDNYVDVLYDNIQEGYVRNFEKLSPSVVNSHGVGYDYNSIMHYNKNYFAYRNGLDTLQARDGSIPLGLAVELSPMDIEQANRLYSDECDEWRPSTLPDPIEPTSPLTPFDCGAVLPGTNGSFVSPRYPSTYPPTTDCAWLIRPPGRFLIIVEFHNVTVEPRLSYTVKNKDYFNHVNGCVKDYIKVYEGGDSKGILRATICGTYLRYPSIIVGTGDVFITFHSDDALQMNGFIATYTTSDLNECVQGGRCSHFCRNTFGGYECSCRHGFYLSADGHTCFDINECGVSNGGCRDVCINTGGSYHCTCHRGHILQPDKVSCRPPGASCRIANGGCHHNCTETLNSRECSCIHGYRLEPDERTCFDINECSYQHENGCEYRCKNTPGSYHCVCNRGYHLNSDNRTCAPDHVCSVNNGECDQKCRSSGDNSALCYCLRGYRLGTDGTTCEDINECEERYRLCHHTCINTNGSYTCGCRDGFQLDYDKEDCINIDECLSHTDECQFHQYCRDTYGSYTCSCPSGYYLGHDRRICIDMDECELGYKYICAHGCRNTPGSFECTCPDGHTLESEWFCRDIDECLVSTHHCNRLTGAQCQNTVGSYTCICPRGFVTDNTGLNCRDIENTEEPSTSTITNTQSVTTHTRNTEFQSDSESTEQATDSEIIQSVTTHTRNTEFQSDFESTEQATDSEIIQSVTTHTRNTEFQSSTEKATDSEIIQSVTTHTPIPDFQFDSESTETVTDSEPATTTHELQIETEYTNKPPVTDSESNVGNEFVNSCVEAACEHVCNIQSRESNKVVSKCSCREGYNLSEDERSCNDINECEEGNGGCSHICTNSVGSFSCNCPSLHYYLSIDGYTCTYYGPPQTQVTPITTPTTKAPPIETSSQSNAPSRATPTTETPPTETPSLSTSPNTSSQATPTNMPSQTVTATPQTSTETTPLSASTPSSYQCGGVLTEESGSFHSENWPETYPKNVNCEWTIILSDPNSVIEISFNGSTFGIAGSLPKCKKDWIKVRSLEKKNNTIIAEWGPFCSFSTPSVIVTNTSVAEVEFYAGPKHGSARKGFKAIYQGLEMCLPNPPPVSVEGIFSCNAIIQVNDKFGPPEYPQYITAETGESCVWILYTRRRAARIRFVYFDLPESDGCVENSVKLYSGLSANNNFLIKTICGRLSGEERFLPVTASYMAVQLKVNPNYYGTIRGFHAVLELA